jgi:hypothetical protein
MEEYSSIRGTEFLVSQKRTSDVKNIVRLLQVAVLAVVVMGVSRPAAAQVKLDSYRVGYQFLHLDNDGGNVPLGFYGDVSGKLGPSLPMLDWLGQVTYGHKSDTIGGVDFSSNLVTFGGGVRYLFPLKDMKFKAHAQGLFLIAHQSVGDVTSNGVTFKGDSSNDPGIEISAAVDYPLSNGWVVTGAAGLQHIAQSSGANVFLLRFGIVRKIG